MNLLTHLFLLLLSVFAVLTASVASSHAHVGTYHPAPHVTAPATDAFGPDLLLLVSDDPCIPVAECSSDCLGDAAIPHSGHGLPAVLLDAANSPAYPVFGFLRARTSEPRAPPHLV